MFFAIHSDKKPPVLLMVNIYTFSIKSMSFFRPGIQATNKRIIPAVNEQTAEEIGPAPLRIKVVSPKLLTAKNISFVSKTNTALKKYKIAKIVLIAASLPPSSGLNDSIIKKIDIKNGTIKPITGRKDPL